MIETSATPQVPEDCYAGTIKTTDIVIGILLKRSSVKITQSWFEGNKVGLGSVIFDEFGSNIIIFNTIFVNNSATQYCNYNCYFPGGILHASRQHRSTVTVKLYHSKFEGNVGAVIIIHGDNTNTCAVSIIHSEFVNNTIIGPQTFLSGSFRSNSLVTLAGVISIHSSEFINNRASIALVSIRYYTVENLTNNIFVGNSAAYEVFVSSDCRPDLSHSLGSSRCILCSENWHQDLIGIMIAAFIAGIALVILMLALNMTVAVGSLNGILFYAHIVGANYMQTFIFGHS